MAVGGFYTCFINLNLPAKRKLNFVAGENMDDIYSHSTTILTGKTGVVNDERGGAFILLCVIYFNLGSDHLIYKGQMISLEANVFLHDFHATDTCFGCSEIKVFHYISQSIKKTNFAENNFFQNIFHSPPP